MHPTINQPTSLGPVEFGIQTERNPENLHKVKQSFQLRTLHNKGMPFLLHVEPAAECNLPCPLCPRGAGLIKRKGLLKLKDFQKVFTTLSPYLCHVVFSGWGEPLLNPNISEMIASVTSHGIQAAMNTNGVFLINHADKLVLSGLNFINISLDGAVSKATHAYPSNKLFSRVAEGVRKLHKAKESMNIHTLAIHGQFIVDEETIDEIPQLTEWAFGLHIDHVKFKRKHEIMPGQIIRYKQKTIDDLRKIEKHEHINSNEDLEFSAKFCAHPWESIFLAATGDLSICSWDPHQKINLGPLGEDFNDIWNGKTVQMLRQWHSLESKHVGEPCRTCNRLPGYLRFEDAV